MSDADTTVRLRLDVADDGSGFHVASPRTGTWSPSAAPAPLSSGCCTCRSITCAGRTGAGVHARGRRLVVHPFDHSIPALFHSGFPFRSFISFRSSPFHCSPCVGFHSIQTPDPFHSTLGVRPVNPSILPSIRRCLFHSPHLFPLGLDGRCRWCGGALGPLLESPDRQVCSPSRSALTAFCHQMVRSITGMVVDVGPGVDARPTTSPPRSPLARPGPGGSLAPPMDRGVGY